MITFPNGLTQTSLNKRAKELGSEQEEGGHEEKTQQSLYFS